MKFLPLLAILGMSGVGRSMPQESVPFDSPRWNSDPVDMSFTTHLERPCIQLRGGSLLLEDVDLVNGVFEVDVALPRERGFIGVVWRSRSFGDREYFYLRPHRTGQPDACQYTPIFHGLGAWQLYTGPGYSKALDFAHDRWTHLKLVVWEDMAWIYVDSDVPALSTVLRRDTDGGTLGLNVAGAFAPAHFADFRYQELEEPPPELTAYPPPTEVPPPLDRQVVASWEISSAFEEAKLLDHVHLTQADTSGLTWSTLAAEPSGRTNLARIQGISGGRNTCFVRLHVEAGAAGPVPFEFGFSDRVRAYLNGRLLYSGNDGYRTRDERFLGTLGYHDTLPLELQEGTNVLVLAVTEDFGGWGVQGRFPADDGLRLSHGER